MVQNKTGTVSYKNHKQISKPESEWVRVENTHEPLISQETWDAVQKMDNHPSRWRSGKTGTVALFGGMLRCMDCGSAMRYMRDYRKKASGKEPEFKAYVCNRYASGGKHACSSHYINQRVLVEIVLLDIRLKAMWAQNNPDGLKDKILKQKNAAVTEWLRSLRGTLTATEKRLAELEKLAQKAELSAKIEAMQQTEHGADEWIGMIQDYSQLETLDRPTLVKLIQKIEIGERKNVNGQDEREIKIYYNFVGFIEL